MKRLKWEKWGRTSVRGVDPCELVAVVVVGSH